MTTRIIQTQEREASNGSRVRLVWVTAFIILVAVLANLGLYAAAGTLFPEVSAWSGAGPGQIIGANFVYLLIGAGVFALIRRFSAHPARLYVTAAVIGLLLSLILPISAGFGYGAPGAPAAGVATVVTLSMMHVVSFVISVVLFIRLGLE